MSKPEPQTEPQVSQQRKRRCRRLTAIQLAFVRAWIARRSASQAYVESHPGASHTTARVEGRKLLKHCAVAAEIAAYLACEEERLQVSARRIVQALSAIAFARVSDLFDRDGRMLPMHRIPAEIAQAVKRIVVQPIVATRMVAGVEVREVVGEQVEVEMHDAITALRLLGLERRMFEGKEARHTDAASLGRVYGRRRSARRRTDGTAPNAPRRRRGRR
jgi:phage terminase small subunit